MSTYILEEFPETEIPPIEEFIEMTIGNDEEITTTFPKTDGFDEKIAEVMNEILTESDDEKMTPTNFKSLLESLVEEVNQDSKTQKEHSEKMSKVGNLVNVFMKENAQSTIMKFLELPVRAIVDPTVRQIAKAKNICIVISIIKS